MATTLIIAEKPSTALKIAEALTEKTPTKSLYAKKIPYYECNQGKDVIRVACAVGHLYTVTEKGKGKGWTYPVFDIEWKESADVHKGSAFTRPYLLLIKKLAEDAQKIIVACDYDIEGEVIGFNIVRFACKKKTAQRMKFSTTTKEDLRTAYENQLPNMDMGLVKAGITRHELDWLFGINLSRALTLSIKHATGQFKILSSGRVQGPTLNILAEREKEIAAFIPVPYWELELVTKELTAFHEHGRFSKKESAEAIQAKCMHQKAIVASIDKKQFTQNPPHPFDLTALQIEAYRVFRIQPQETLELAQNLYINSYISYPRTSSNQLPESIGYKKVIQKLSKQQPYEALCKDLLQVKLSPNNGKKQDGAHPAIYPTGEVPKQLSERETKLYDLIVKRFLSTFAKPAVRESVTVSIDVNKEKFVTKGVRTIDKQWHRFYTPYLKLEEEEIHVKDKQELHVLDIPLHNKQTTPPKRYTPASVIKELEHRNLGTKATRAETIENLFDRAYLKRGESIEVTELGLKTVEILNKYCPEILDEKLTRNFEEDMDKIQKRKTTEKEVIAHAHTFLTLVLKKFKEKEKEIGSSLSNSYMETLKEARFIAKCSCGGDLAIKFSPKFKSYFIACSKYPECTQTYSLPREFLAKPSDKLCDRCQYPEVTLIRKGKRPWAFCINPQCPKKEEYRQRMNALKENTPNKISDTV